MDGGVIGLGFGGGWGGAEFLEKRDADPSPITKELRSLKIHKGLANAHQNIGREGRIDTQIEVLLL